MKRWYKSFAVLAVCLLSIGSIGFLGIQHSEKAAYAQNPVTFTEFPVPQNSNVESVTAGPDGNVWFTLFQLQVGPTYGMPSDIGRITPSGAISLFPLPSTNEIPGSITTGPDGNLWFTDNSGTTFSSSIGRITPSGGITEFALGSSHRLDGITAGSDGNLWFIDDIASAIGRITTAGVVTEFPVPSIGTGGVQNQITTGSDGNLWFTDLLNADSIGRITPQGIVTEYHVSLAQNSLSDPGGITGGPDGNIWFSFDRAIGQITPTGTATLFPIPNAGVDTYGYWTQGITAGPDGNVWFTEPSAFKIGSITPSGTITEYSLPTNNYYSGYSIVTGRDGNIWFAEDDKTTYYSHAIVRMNVSSTPSATSPSWAGYVSQYPPKNPVSARVTLPAVICNRVGQIAMWVGYDGWEADSNTVEQTGVSADCTSVGGTATFYLWYELFKAKSLNPFPNVHQIPINVPVHLAPGDNVDLFVNIITPDRLARIPLGRDEVFFSINVNDPSGHPLMKPWTKTVVEPLAFSPRYDSAECIAEAPSTTANGQMALPDFGTVTFTNCSSIDDNTALLRVNMSRGGHLLASTSDISHNANGENSFSVTWVSSS